MLKENILRGKILKERLHKYSQDSGVSLTKLAEKAGYDQSTMYRHFAKADLALHIIQKYARVIHYDFSGDIPDMKELESVASEPSVNYGLDDLSQCQERMSYWREKYISLLEKHNRMLEEKLGAS